MGLPMFYRSLLADFDGGVQTPIASKVLLHMDLIDAGRRGQTSVDVVVADGVGFEPTVGVNPRRFSRPVP